MRAGPPRTIQGRAIIGMVALYALLLQAFLGTLLPSAPALSAPALTICGHEDTGQPQDQACRPHACCIVAQAAGLLHPPQTGYAAVAWTARRETRVIWNAADAAQARAPPDRSVSARGPPAA